MDWNKYPTATDRWNKEDDYLMFVDENNSVSSINIIKRNITQNVEVNPNENIFTVTGCIFSRSDYNIAVSKMDALRQKYWENGQYYNSAKDNIQTVCFHSEDIRGHKKAFHKEVLNESNYDKFISDLDSLLKEIPYKIISININLKDYLLNPHNTEMNVYKVAFNFIVERFIYNMRSNAKGSIIFEARGKKENRELLEHINRIINITGTEFIDSKELSKKINGIYFNKKMNTHGHPFTGIEITDLSSYPIHRYIKFQTIGRDFKTISSKIIGYPNCNGKGLKIYPKK